MNKVVDFTNAEKGKFYKKDAVMEFPVYLSQSNFEYLNRVAEKNNANVTDILNRIVENEIKNFELILK